MAEVGRVEDGHAEELERRIVVCEIVIGLIVDYRPGLELPERRPGGFVGAELARGKHRLPHHRAVAVEAPGAARNDPRIVRQQHAQAANHAAPQVAGKLDGIGEQHLTARLSQRDVAGCDHHAIALPVADARGTQNALALGDLDIAGCDDRIGLFVVSQLIGGHQEIAREQVIDARRGVSLLCARLQRGEGQETRENEWHEGLNPHFSPRSWTATPFGSHPGARPRRCGPQPYSPIRSSARSWRIERLGATQAVTVVSNAGSSCRRYPSSRWNRPATPSNVKMPAGVHAASTGGSLPERPRARTRSETK